MFKKRLFVVDNTRVLSLLRQGRRITGLLTDRGPVRVDESAKVFLALGTIESTRLALQSLPNEKQLIGRNLMAHLRSNVTVRVPRASFPELDPASDPRNKELQISAMFVKGIHDVGANRKGHFHIQITASGVGELGSDSEAELFKKIPNIDELDRFDDLTDKWVVITFRGIGEMFGDKTAAAVNRVTLETKPGGRPARGGTQKSRTFKSCEQRCETRSEQRITNPARYGWAPLPTAPSQTSGGAFGRRKICLRSAPPCCHEWAHRIQCSPVSL
jgi:hypothetical protein